jgi:tRNA-dihydrouridine synthase B
MSSISDKQTRTEALRDLIRGGGAACAPMAGITDGPYRRISRRMGSIFVTTEFLSSEGLKRGGRRTLEMAAYDEGERPLGIQIFGSKPDAMREGAVKAAALGPDFIEINFGCPVRKVVRVSGGSACMKDLDLMGRIIDEVNGAIDIPLSVKMRAGWDDSSRNAPEAARIAESAGAAWVTVHGRTRAQLYRGKADLDIIRRTREAVSIPVIGNGDVTDAASYQRMLDETGVDSVLVGRGCIGNPWIFAEIEAHRRGESWGPPTPQERAEVIFEHMDAKVAERGERHGVVSFRMQMSHYLKGLPGVTALRKDLFLTDEPDRAKDLILAFIRNLAT